MHYLNSSEDETDYNYFYLQHGSDWFKDTWWKSEVEKTICLTFLDCRHFLVKKLKVPLSVIASCNIVVCCPELLQQVLFPLLGLHCPRTFLPQLGDSHLGPGIAKYLGTLQYLFGITFLA